MTNFASTHYRSFSRRRPSSSQFVIIIGLDIGHVCSGRCEGCGQTWIVNPSLLRCCNVAHDSQNNFVN